MPECMFSLYGPGYCTVFGAVQITSCIPLTPNRTCRSAHMALAATRAVLRPQSVPERSNR